MGEINIHASCVAIGSQGVLLIGPSGAGKSDLALRLIDGGASLVADDRTLLCEKKGMLYARAPASIAGLLEIHGVGIVQLPVRAKVRVALVVKLERPKSRLPRPRPYRPPVPLWPQCPQIAVDPKLASAPAKVRAALAGFARGLFRDTFITK